LSHHNPIGIAHPEISGIFHYLPLAGELKRVDKKLFHKISTKHAIMAKIDHV
jgi:hypothetical protein